MSEERERLPWFDRLNFTGIGVAAGLLCYVEIPGAWGAVAGLALFLICASAAWRNP